MSGSDDMNFDPSNPDDLSDYEEREVRGAQATSRPCPKCGAKVGVRCRNLRKRTGSGMPHTKYPHAERLEPKMVWRPRT